MLPGTAAALVAAVLGLAGIPVHAQEAAPPSWTLDERIDRIDRDFGELRQDLGAVAPYAVAQASQMGPSEAAELSLRLDRIEEAVRTLTGQIERLQFDVRQAGERLDGFAADTDFRLRDLEGVGGPPSPVASGGAASGAAPELRPPADAGPLAPAPGALGTVSAQAAADMAARDSGLGAAPAPGPGLTPPPAGMPAPLGPPLAAGSAEDDYAAAMSLLRQGDYPAAQAAFSQFLEMHGNSRLAGNAQYWLGETYYVREQYEAAARAFLAGYQTYGSSPKAPDSLLKLGITLLALGQTQDGCAALSEVARTFPNAPQSVKLRAEQERSRAGCG